MTETINTTQKYLIAGRRLFLDALGVGINAINYGDTKPRRALLTNGKDDFALAMKNAEPIILCDMLSRVAVLSLFGLNPMGMLAYAGVGIVNGLLREASESIENRFHVNKRFESIL
ncbi:MAG: hypothetical protein WAV40_00575 [Microgenomates group bacterium]